MSTLKTISNRGSAAAALVFFSSVAFFSTMVLAHSPICECYDNGDDTVTCEGGFSDGSSAEGAPIKVFDLQGKLLLEGKMSARSEFSFTMPDGDFRVVFDAGEGHSVEIDSRDIEE